MEGHKEDRRIRRTKKLLKQALAQLMDEKEFKDITVRDITERADLNRGTFYLHYRDVYENQEYVDGTKLAQAFFAPVQQQLYENGQSAVEYAKEQTALLKREFSKKFAELDAILIQKLKEMEECAKDSQDIECRIQESQAKLKWLEDIQNRIKEILDI